MAAQYPPPLPQYQPAPAADRNAGRTVGIIGLIFAFLFPLVGLILGIVSIVQAKNGGGSKGLGLAATIISAVFMIIGIIVLVAAMSTLGAACAQLGPGVHFVNGSTITCG